MDLNLVWAALAGALLGSLADWLFASVVFRERYRLHPEVWRQGNERGRLAASQALVLVTSIAFVLLAWKTHQTDGRGALKLAAMIWLTVTSRSMRMNMALASSIGSGPISQIIAASLSAPRPSV